MIHIKAALVEAGVTQIALATALEIHPSSLSRIACGWVAPSKELAAMIEEHLGLGPIAFGRRSVVRSDTSRGPSSK